MSLSPFTDKASDIVFRFVKPYSICTSSTTSEIDPETTSRIHEYLGEFPVFDRGNLMEGSFLTLAEIFLSKENRGCSIQFRNELLKLIKGKP